jgi:hypothetical protein
MQDFTAALTARGPERPRERRGLARYRLHLLRGWDAAAELARQVEREVFGEVFGNTSELLAHEYGRFEDASVFRDEAVPVFDARVLADAHGDADLRLIEGGGHELRHDPRAVAVLLGWLDRQRNQASMRRSADAGAATS